MRTPLTVILVLGVALYGLWLVTESGESSPESAAAARPAPVSVIAGRVESLRGLSFTRVPTPLAVSGAQARREGLEDLDRTYPPARREADEEVLKLLGLIEPSVTLRDVSAQTFSEGVAGYYDPRTERLRTVKGAATATRVLFEMVLAHELTHALEDQRFDLRLEDVSGTDDAQLARLALVEGTATVLMYRYVDRFFTREEALGGVLAGAFGPTGAGPPFLQATLLFPYVGGERFVADLRSRAGGRWTLVDLAERVRPPASTEQVLHPERYVDADPPRRVRLRVRLGDGWKRKAAGTFGELQTREMLAFAGGGGSTEAAAGWGGDRYELWQRGDAGSCAAPCRDRDVLVARWVWDTPADADEFEAKLRQWVRDSSLVSDSFVVRRGDAVTLALAPSARTARRVATAAG
jgi:hypothetical protein